MVYFEKQVDNFPGKLPCELTRLTNHFGHWHGSPLSGSNRPLRIPSPQCENSGVTPQCET